MRQMEKSTLKLHYIWLCKKDVIDKKHGKKLKQERRLRESINPFTTDDECTHHAILAACYQLAQSFLGFALAKNGGIGEDGRA